MTKIVHIVDGARSPFLKAGGDPSYFSALELARQVGQALLLRQPFAAKAIEEVIMGCMIPSEKEANIARILALHLGIDQSTPAWTVQRNCASGLQAIDSAFASIISGRHDLVLCGGVDAMSRAPLLYPQSYSEFLARLMRARTLGAKLALLTRFRLKFFKPIISLLCGLTDPTNGLSMGQTAEELAYLGHISREQMDEFALHSHQKAAKNEFTEITPLYSPGGQLFKTDNGVRDDSSLKKLAKLKPFFDKKYGQVTPGNSAQVTDGAALLLLAGTQSLRQHKLTSLARLSACAWVGLAPEKMGLGPVYAIHKLLQQTELTLADIDYFEINEAFAAQVLACQQALADEDFCQTQLGVDQALGEIDPDRLNVDGGAIAIGHPVGASGARIVLHLAHVLKQNNARYGIASLCIGGGQGGAVLIENTQT